MLKIKTVEVTPFIQNCRIVWDSNTGECVVVDPGGEIDKIISALAENNLTVSSIWLTHSHIDHCGGVKTLKDHFGDCKLLGHINEKEMRMYVMELAKLYGLTDTSIQPCPEPDQYIDEGDVVRIGEHEFNVLFTPGHSPGHVVFYNEANNLLLGGDVLFYDSIGRTDLPGSDHATLMRSIKEKILTLPDETQVLTGHGPHTTIGRERVSNPFIKDICLV